ncbi:MAG TPA: hypothetical protein VGM23_03900 [Armatimonadota bacterium]
MGSYNGGMYQLLAQREPERWATPAAHLPVILSADLGLELIGDGLSRDARRRVLRAAAGDWLSRLSALPEVEVWISCRRHWEDVACLGLRRWRGATSLDEREKIPRLFLALDAPTVPLGYVKTAVDQLRNGGSARVAGPLREGGCYLWGFGKGSGTVTLPAWYRILLPGGLQQARLDLLRGCYAPETAQAIRTMA